MSDRIFQDRFYQSLRSFQNDGSHFLTKFLLKLFCLFLQIFLLNFIAFIDFIAFIKDSTLYSSKRHLFFCYRFQISSGFISNNGCSAAIASTTVIPKSSSFAGAKKHLRFCTNLLIGRQEHDPKIQYFHWKFFNLFLFV